MTFFYSNAAPCIKDRQRPFQLQACLNEYLHTHSDLRSAPSSIFDLGLRYGGLRYDAQSQSDRAIGVSGRPVCSLATSSTWVTDKSRDTL
jgi:hypothetical protein